MYSGKKIGEIMKFLKWKDVWNNETTFEKTVKWYKVFYEEDKKILTKHDLKSYVHDATLKNIEWAK